jgi:hypothetical protein
MKAYYSDEGLRLCGKAWEVRRSLRALVTAQGENALLSGYLHKRSGSPAARVTRSPGNSKEPRLSHSH